MMIIPREKGMIRFYVQQAAAESIKARTLEATKDVAQRILAPFELKWEHIDWFSCYKVAQGIAARYSSDSQRVFLGGDACHVHSVSLLKPTKSVQTLFLKRRN